MTKFLGLFGLILLSSSSFCTSQVTDSAIHNTNKEKRYYLVLDKPGKITRLRFYVGNRLNFKLIGENRKYSAVITGIQKETIIVHQTQIALSEIDRITVPQRANGGQILNGLGNGLRGAGSLFLLVGASNFLLKSKDRENGRVTAQIGLTTLLVGQLFRGFRKRTYRLNKSRQLKTIEII